MRGTITLLEHLIGPSIGNGNLVEHFAMINAAKCAGRDKDMSKVPHKLYVKCRPYAYKELSILGSRQHS
jgi:hypothetical protein